MTDEPTNGATLPASSSTMPLRLCALDTLFAATGVVHVKVGEHSVPVPIQSVDVELVQAMAGKPPRAPMFTERRDGVTSRIRDLANPDYMEQLERYNRDQMLIWVCMAIAIDICDRHGSVVWSADNSTHNLEGAKQALKDMGLVDNQLLGIFQAARNLTDSTVEARSLE